MAIILPVRFLSLALFFVLTLAHIFLLTTEASKVGLDANGVHSHHRRATFRGIGRARVERRKQRNDVEKTTLETTPANDADVQDSGDDVNVEDMNNEDDKLGVPSPPTKTKARHSGDQMVTSAASTSTEKNNDDGNSGGDDDSKPYNPATIPTPISSTVNTAPVPLFIPPYDPQVHDDDLHVQYLGPGNAHSTVYQVLYASQDARPAVTATLIEDASAAKLIGAQQATVLSDGHSTTVWAAVSCGFQDGLSPDKIDPAAGYCVYQNNIDRVTSTWTTAVSTITAQTTITPSPGAVQSSIAASMSRHGEAFVKPHNGIDKLNVPSLCPVLVSFAFFFFL